MDKIIEETGCSLTVALAWAVSAKNSLANVYGYSPNQLVFGRNPNFPSVLTDDLPALHGSTSSELIADHLNALHSARKHFVQSEASSKLRQALRRKTRTATSLEYDTGDLVYYKRLNSKRWHGPGTVIGKEGKQVFVKHGGTYLRVNPCHLKQVHEKSSLLNDTTNEVVNSNENADIQLSESDQENSLLKDTSNEVVNSNDNADTELSESDKENSLLIDTNNEVVSSTENADTESSESDQENFMHGESEDSIDLSNESDNDDDTCSESIQHDNDVDLSIRMENLSLTGSNHSMTHGDKNSTKSIIPKAGSRISYQINEEDDRRQAKVLGRAGKATGKHRLWINIQDEDESIKSLNCEELEDWKYVTEDVLLSMNETNNLDVINAKFKELKNWNDHSVYEEVDDHGQKAISCRWVLTEKSENGEKIVKARLVARGFEERNEDIRKDSPTCLKESMRLTLLVASTHNWNIKSLDIRSAFLQGKEISRDLFIKPPKEAGTNKIWKLRKSVYGLCDASRVWYLRVKEELLQAGTQMSIYDEALFYWKYDGHLHGILAAHVDDFLYCGSKMFMQNVITVIKNKFQISKEATDSFRHLGLEIEQKSGFIILHQHKYIQEIQQIVIDSKKSMHDILNGDEMKKLQTLVGQLSWTAIQTRGDIAFETCQIGSNIKNATVSDVKKANKCVKKLRNEEIKLLFPSIGNIKKAMLCAYSDASFNNLPNGGSQGGFIIFMVSENGKYAPLCWSSRKIRRVVKSTLAAETLSLIDASEHCYLIQQICKELYDVDIDIICITDNRSLRDAAYSTRSIEDKRLTVDICSIRDKLNKKEIKEIRWVTNECQIADPLTKSGASCLKLIQALSGSIQIM